MTCIWSSWCHCHPITSCFSKIQNGLSFWYQLTQESWKVTKRVVLLGETDLDDCFQLAPKARLYECHKPRESLTWPHSFFHTILHIITSNNTIYVILQKSRRYSLVVKLTDRGRSRLGRRSKLGRRLWTGEWKYCRGRRSGGPIEGNGEIGCIDRRSQTPL